MMLEKAVEKVFDLTSGGDHPSSLTCASRSTSKLAAYGHMGREELGVKWENTDKR